MRPARFSSAIALALLLGGCALFSPWQAGADPRGLTMKQRGATVVLALERYRRDNGRLPGHLFELLPKYLPQLPDGLATDYRPADNRFAFTYQPPGRSFTTTCAIAIGTRAWDCADSL
jgi:hypothetical protein